MSVSTPGVAPAKNLGPVMVEFSGEIISVRFQGKDNGFCIFSIKDKKLGELIVKGQVPPISKGVCVSGHGMLADDPKWGRQLTIKQVKVEQPQSMDAVVKYLGGGIIDGLGPKGAQAIAKHFGPKTMDIIRNEPQRLREVPGIGPKRAAAISQNARAFIQVEKIMTFLLEHGLSTNMAYRIYKEYGDPSIEMIKANPWILAEEIHGIGFQTADRVAHSMGLRGAHPGRIEAALMHVMSTCEQEGHTAITVAKALQEASKLTGLAPSLPEFQEGLGRLGSKAMISDFTLKDEKGEDIEVLQRTRTAKAEHDLAEKLRHMIVNAQLPWNPRDLLEVMRREVGTLPWKLSGDQIEALKKMIYSPVCILTAGPGCGKTTLVGLMLTVLNKYYAEVDMALCAPTGKAAQRATESTGNLVQGMTTHRLLKSDDKGRFLFNEANRLPARYLVADESSMYDVRLAGSLVKALAEGCALLWVGDIDQLPSVGAGAVLNDMIQSSVIPVARLTQIHRQGEGSKIVTNAHAVNRGKVAEVTPGHDFEIHPVLTSEDVRDRIGHLVTTRIAELGFGQDDIMILTAGHRGPSGTIEMNAYLKGLLNPKPSASIHYGKSIFSVGDKILVTRNNYDLDVRNGMMGRILGINAEEGTVVTLIEGQEVVFKKSELADLDLGYCITIHKSQGSQAPCVLLAVDKAHFMLLERSLLYTGITRAAKHCMVVSREESLAIAVNTKRSRSRLTTLKWRLQVAA